MNFLLAIVSLLAGFSRGNKLIVLTYHRVLAGVDVMYPNEVTVDKFSWQMALLDKYFNVLSLSDALEHLKKGTLPPRAVCLSFDDGYASCYTDVLPILKLFNFSACFFIVSSALNQKGMWNDLIVESVRSIPGDELDLSPLGLGIYSLVNREKVAQEIVESVKYLPMAERKIVCNQIVDLAGINMPELMLSLSQLCTMQSEGMEIGGHTVNHPILKNLTFVEAEYEVSQNKHDLEKILGKPIRFFAYPNGRLNVDYVSEQVDIVRACGYEAALTTDWGSIDNQSDLWQLPRYTPWDNSPLRFMFRMMWGYFR